MDGCGELLVMKIEPRTARVQRKTYETDIEASINLDGVGERGIETGIGFWTTC